MLQVLLKPAQDMLQAFFAQFGMTTARKAMALALETHEKHLASHVLQGGKKLLSLLDVTAQILFAVNDQERRMHVLDVSQGRHAPVEFGIFPGSGLHIIVGEVPAHIAAPKER